jgi:cytochrome c biogenesis protein CcmG/thiol:disulfide interchange protein DsbE
MRSLKFIIPLAIFLSMLWFLRAGLSLDPHEVPSPLINKPAPVFALTRLDDANQTLRSKDLLGTVWVLNVWASWCVACREEHPLLVAYSKQAQVAVYGLNYKDTRADGLGWLSSFGNPYRASFFDEAGKVGIDFGVYGVPETFIVDKQGVIRMKHIGPLTSEVIQTKIQPLIRQLNG